VQAIKIANVINLKSIQRVNKTLSNQKADIASVISPVQYNTNPLLSVQCDSYAKSWQASPTAGVWRKPLARESRESGHATSLVKYDAGASFARHDHPKGEEILVLKGVFSDEHGDYPAGSYLRNPAGFQHRPYSKDGCIIFVKLHQFQDGDILRTKMDINNAMLFTRHRAGHKSLCLHEHKKETVTLYQFETETIQKYYYEHGAEVLVLEGAIEHEGDVLSKGSWLRLSPDSPIEWRVATNTKLWLKEGHLGLSR